MLYKRFIENQITIALQDTPIVLVIGARRCGKTTLVQSLGGGGRKYITLDDERIAQHAKDDPQGFIRDLDRVTIDEIQRVPELILAIKMSVDQDRSYGRFLLTGSANVLMLPQVIDSLAGRIEIIRLFPLSQSEILGITPTFLDSLFSNNLNDRTANTPLIGSDLIQMVLTGGYPEVKLRDNQDRQRAWMENYINLISTRDLKDIANIANIAKLPTFLNFIANYSAKIINYSAFASSIDVSYKTSQHYLSMLELVFFTTVIRPWFTNNLKRLVKTPKLYILDSGILTTLLGLNLNSIQQDRNKFGAILETFVLSEILKLISVSNTKITPYHFSQHQKCEVDIVLQSNDGMIVGIEVKSNVSAKPADFKGLKILKDVCKDRFSYGIVLCDRTDVVSCGEKLAMVPLSYLWK